MPRGVGVETRDCGYRMPVPPSPRRQLDCCLEAQPQSVAALRQAIVEFAAAHGASAQQCEDIALAVSEAVTNIVLHAYVDRDAPGMVALEASTQRATLEVLVRDEGRGIRPRPDSPGLGLGLKLMHRVCERLVLEDVDPPPGSRVHMTFAIG
jgi:serine/threonine-protein kinase RsbW